MKNQIQVKRKIFGKSEYLPKFISWNTKHHGEKSYSVREAQVSDIFAIDDKFLSSKVNFNDKVFLLEEDSLSFDQDDFYRYMSTIDLESEYISLLEITENQGTYVYVIGRKRSLKIYDSDSSKYGLYESIEGTFVKTSVFWSYDLDKVKQPS